MEQSHPSQGAQGNQLESISRFLKRKANEGDPLAEESHGMMPAKAKLTSDHKVSSVQPLSITNQANESHNIDNDNVMKPITEDKEMPLNSSVSSGIELANKKHCSDCEEGLDSSFEGEFKIIMDPNASADDEGKRRSMIRRKSTLFDNRTAIGKYIDVFWRKEIEMKNIESSADIETAVHNRISKMLYMGE